MREQPGCVNGTLEEFVQTVDWDLLRQQKHDLVSHVNAVDIPCRESLIGILHLIDGLQDAVVDANLKTEHDVFGTFETTE